MISSNLVCFLWMLSIQYGSKRLKELKVLVDTEEKPVKGLRNQIKQKVRIRDYSDEDPKSVDFEMKFKTFNRYIKEVFSLCSRLAGWLRLIRIGLLDSVAECRCLPRIRPVFIESLPFMSTVLAWWSKAVFCS